MISAPPGWTLIPEAGLLELVHPAGRAAGVIHYRERVRPLVSVGAAVRGYLALHRHFVDVEVPERAERLITAEGEHATLVTVRGAEQGVPAQRDLGFVFGDDFYASIVGQCRDAALFAESTARVRELVLGDSHALGVRRRRFEYTPPRDWEPIVENLVTDWYPPGFPDESLILTVYAASPRKLTPILVFAKMVHELTQGGHHVDVQGDPAAIRAEGGLHGSVLTMTLRRSMMATGRTLIKRLAILEDARYAYNLELTAGTAAQLAAHEGLLEQVVASVKAIPEPVAAGQDRAFAAVWID